MPLAQRKERRKLHFADPEVCKYELCGCCPYVLFTNTKSALGPCEYAMHADHLHWNEVQEQWDALAPRERLRYGYDGALARLLQRLVREMDMRVDKARERARAESEPRPLMPAQQAEVDGMRARVSVRVVRECVCVDGGGGGERAAAEASPRA